MSNTKRLTKHPETKQFELATWIDDYFGEHNYGIIFDSSPNVIHDSRDEEFEVKENKTDWESRFDKKLSDYANAYYWDNEGWTKKHLTELEKQDKLIKDFIRTLLAEQREEMVEKIKAVPDTNPDMESDFFDSGLQTMKANILKII